jgi:hypothetical protein
MAARKKNKPLGFPAGNPRGILGPDGTPLTGAQVKQYAAIDKQTVKQTRAYIAATKAAAKKPAAKPAGKPVAKKPAAKPAATKVVAPKLTREQKNLAAMKTAQSKTVQKRKAK